MAKMDENTIKLSAIGSILLFDPDEITVEHKMRNNGDSEMTIKLTSTKLRNLAEKIKGGK